MTGRRRNRGRAGERTISLKSESELAAMRRAGQLVGLTLERLADAAVPGVTTEELDRLAEATIRSFGGVPTFYKLYGYPAHLCVSINDEVVHGIPGPRALKSGDIVSFDVGATVDGLIGDAAITVGVAPISEEAKRLLEVTQASLMKGIESARPGNRVADISRAVQAEAEAHGYSVVRKLVGHGVGHEMHEAPHIPNFVDETMTESAELRPGMTLAIEPMVNAGGWQVVQEADGWTYRTSDGSLSAHFEHTIAITEDRAEILTLRHGLTREDVRREKGEASGRRRGALGGG